MPIKFATEFVGDGHPRRKGKSESPITRTRYCRLRKSDFRYLVVTGTVIVPIRSDSIVIVPGLDVTDLCLS